jgi:hypothetical protein
LIGLLVGIRSNQRLQFRFALGARVAAGSPRFKRYDHDPSQTAQSTEAK